MIIRCNKCDSKFDIPEEKIDFTKIRHIRCQNCDQPIYIFDPKIERIKIECPVCRLIYKVPKKEIKKRIMHVRCSNCAHFFHQEFDFAAEKDSQPSQEFNFEETILAHPPQKKPVSQEPPSSSNNETLSPEEQVKIFDENAQETTSDDFNNKNILEHNPITKGDNLSFDADSTAGEKIPSDLTDAEQTEKFLADSEIQTKKKADKSPDKENTQFNPELNALIDENENRSSDDRTRIAKENARASTILPGSIPSLDDFNISREEEFDVTASMQAELEEEKITMLKNKNSVISLKDSGEIANKKPFRSILSSAVQDKDSGTEKETTALPLQVAESPEEEYRRLTTLEKFTRENLMQGRIEKKKKEILFLPPKQFEQEGNRIDNEQEGNIDTGSNFSTLDFEMKEDFQDLLSDKNSENFAETEKLSEFELLADIKKLEQKSSFTKKIIISLTILILMAMFVGIFFSSR